MATRGNDDGTGHSAQDTPSGTIPEGAGSTREHSSATDESNSLVRGAGGALLGVFGLGAVGGTASAAGGSKQLLVVGIGRGTHAYTIEMESGGRITKGKRSGGNDSIGRTSNGTQRLDGTLWNWKLDSYTYTGSVKRVVVDGSVSVHFLGGDFSAPRSLTVTGQGSGKHHFEIGSKSADLGLDPGTTENVDSDEGGSHSEKNHTPDLVSGRVKGTGSDTFTIGGAQLHNLEVRGGHVEFTG